MKFRDLGPGLTGDLGGDFCLEADRGLDRVRVPESAPTRHSPVLGFRVQGRGHLHMVMQ